MKLLLYIGNGNGRADCLDGLFKNTTGQFQVHSTYFALQNIHYEKEHELSLCKLVTFK